MSIGNGNGHDQAGPPEGAMVLTLDLLRKTSRKWVQLPALTFRLQRMAPEALAQLLVEAQMLSPDPPETVVERAQAGVEVGVYVQIRAVGALEAMTMSPLIPG